MADLLKLDPAQRRQLESDITQLQADGYGREDLIDYAKGFKEGYSSPSLMGKVAQGATLETADELKGLVQSRLTGNSRLFETARARGQLARTGREYPKTSLALEIAGGIPTALGAGKVISKVLGGPATGMAGKLREGIAGGAATGAVVGAGSGVGGLDQRAIDAMVGGLGGGVMGGLAVPLVEGGAAVMNRIGSALLPGVAKGQAKQMFEQAIEEGSAAPGVAGVMSRPSGPAPPPSMLRQPTAPPANFAPDDYSRLISGRMSEAQAGGTPFTMGEAIGPGGVGLLETAAQATGPGQTMIKAGLEGRQYDQSGRLLDALRRTSGVTEGSVDKILATKAARSTAARTNYADLGAVDAPDEVMREIWRFMQTKAGRGAYTRAAEAAEQARFRGDPSGSLPTFDQIKGGARLTAGEADTLLQGLETYAEKRMTAPIFEGGKKVETGESYPFSASARKLRELMADRIPEFQKARAEYKAPSDFIKSIEIGDKVRKMDLDNFKTYWRSLNASQQEGTKLGMINDLKAELEDFVSGPQANAARLLSKKESLREKLRIAMGPDADDLLKVADVENLTSENVNQILGGPATSRRIVGEKTLGEPIEKEVPTSTAGLTAKLLGWLDESTKRKTREAIARLGLTTDPARAEALVREIMARPPSARAGKSGALIGAPAGLITGSMTDR